MAMQQVSHWWCISALLMMFALASYAFGLEQLKLCDEAIIDPGRARTWTICARKLNGSVSEEERANVLVIPQGKAVLLEMWARLHYGRLAGSTTAMVIRINGMTLDAEQLVNKPLHFQTRGGAALAWYGAGSWRILYSPDFKAATEDVLSPYSVADANPYKFVFDITELIVDGENTITIQHTIPSIASRLMLSDVVVRIGEVGRVEIDKGAKFPVYVPRLPQPFGYFVQWLNGGGMRISVFDEHFIVSTSVSIPGGGWHVLGERELPTPCGMNLQIEGGRRLLMRAKCAHYAIERSAECHGEWIDVHDELMNLTGVELGVCIRHLVELCSDKPTSIYLGGMKIQSPQFKRRSSNMTALLVGKRAMVGMLPLDDVFRVHCASIRDGDACGICDAELVLPPNGVIRMRWRIHPLPRPQPLNFEPDADYWAFINSVRRGLNVNFTLEGPFAFLSPAMLKWRDEELLRWLELRKVKFVSSTIGRLDDGKYAHGTAYLSAKEDHEIWKRLFARIRSLRPQTKCLMYFHCFISTEEGAVEKYGDSRLVDTVGKQLAYPHSTYLPLFYPTLTNSYGAAVVRYFDVALNQIGADGIYWDEVEYSANMWTYDCWDGYSADIHPTTFSVLRKKAAIPLLTQPWKVTQIERLLKAGKVIIGNGMPLTETMASLCVPRFRETGSLLNLLDSHVYTPIGLGDHLTQRTEQDVIDQIRRNLNFGALYYYYSPLVPQTRTNLTEHMFPFTPLELHCGVLIGQERILTNRSGVFGWGEKADVKVFVYDDRGRLIKFEPIIYTEGGATFVRLNLPPRYVAAIVRRQ
ncbi:MAG: hypothetical protein RMK18_00710 [Armatimonadota bacterium]|nr:hypothetical protein [Armatimonadota bacterium]MCX7777308.1 hypothetical protein [Armatimonadota bacterium]MDW8024375.1 hypothetical protein [Armatimonadota bacterium]